MVLLCRSGEARGYSFPLLARLDWFGLLEGGRASPFGCGWIPSGRFRLDLFWF